MQCLASRGLTRRPISNTAGGFCHSTTKRCSSMIVAPHGLKTPFALRRRLGRQIQPVSARGSRALWPFRDRRHMWCGPGSIVQSALPVRRIGIVIMFSIQLLKLTASYDDEQRGRRIYYFTSCLMMPLGILHANNFIYPQAHLSIGTSLVNMYQSAHSRCCKRLALCTA